MVVLPKNAPGSYACFAWCQEGENQLGRAMLSVATNSRATENPLRRRWNQVHWVMKSDLAAAKQKGATRVTW